MRIINYISSIAIPLMISLILLVGIKEKKKVYDVFLKGVKEGINIVIKLFPTLLAIFLAVGMLRNCGLFMLVKNLIPNINGEINMYTELIPLAILRPLSGSASLAIATDIMKVNGVDSTMGKIASTIMGSTETTVYTIALYTSCVKIKKTRFILVAALIADLTGIIISVIMCNILK